MTFLNRIATVALVVWLCTMLGAKGRQLVQRSHGDMATEARITKHWQELVDGRAPVLGTPSARLKIVEFSDYQCPYCAAAEPVLTAFVASHSAETALYRFDFPLETIHRYSYPAAVAANCAELQGITVPYQSLLFEHRDEFASLNWTALAKQGGVGDADAFARCIQEDTPHNRIRKDMAQGKDQIGITATPTFIINRELITGVLSESKLEALYWSMDHPHHRGLLDRFSALFSN